MASLMERILMKVFRFKDIRKEVDGEMSLYMRRFYIFKVFGYAAFIHKIYRSDEDRFMHDHPWPFVTVILKNGYREEIPGRTRLITAPAIVKHSATDLHRLHLLEGNPTWSIFLHGRRCREWGFQTDEGWVHHMEYFKAGSEVDSRDKKVVNMFS